MRQGSIIAWVTTFFLGNLLLSEYARSMDSKTFRIASAICSLPNKEHKKDLKLSNQKVCRTKAEHKKILNWNCKSKKGTLQKLDFTDECKSK